jgi:hypothetical protein
MSAPVEQERAVDLVLDEPEVDVAPDLEVDEPLTPIEMLMLPGETPRQTLRRLLNEAGRARLVAMYGPGWHQKVSLADQKLPR